MGLRHLSWMISTVHDESRTIPPRRRCARPTSRFTAAKSAPAGAAGHPGQHRAGGTSGGDGRDTRDQAARRGIEPNSGRIRYDTCCGRSRFTNSSKRAGTASGRRLRSAAVDSFKRDENHTKRRRQLRNCWFAATVRTLPRAQSWRSRAPIVRSRPNSAPTAPATAIAGSVTPRRSGTTSAAPQALSKISRAMNRSETIYRCLRGDHVRRPG